MRNPFREDARRLLIGLFPCLDRMDASIFFILSNASSRSSSHIHTAPFLKRGRIGLAMWARLGMNDAS